jgi:hypothetical protein
MVVPNVFCRTIKSVLLSPQRKTGSAPLLSILEAKIAGLRRQISLKLLILNIFSGDLKAFQNRCLASA